MLIVPPIITPPPIVEASTIIYLIVSLLIFIRLLIKPTDMDKLIYLTLFSTSFIWINLLLYVFYEKCDVLLFFIPQ